LARFSEVQIIAERSVVPTLPAVDTFTRRRRHGSAIMVGAKGVAATARAFAGSVQLPPGGPSVAPNPGRRAIKVR